MICVKQFTKRKISQDDLETAFSRTNQVDEYKHNVHISELTDIPSFKYFIDTGVMHDQIKFILYSQEAMDQWNIGNYVYPHKDGAKENDPFHVSLVAPVENYQHSMIRWFKGHDEEDDIETIRTGRFMKNFDHYKECELVDSYTFKDDSLVLFRVDVWHDVLIPFPGRKIMRWLLKPNFKWDSAIETFSSEIS